MSPGKTEVEQGIEFINSISPNPKFTLGIIQIRVKSLSSFSVLSSIKNKLICTISISDFNLTQSSGCVYVQSVNFYVSLYFFISPKFDTFT